MGPRIGQHVVVKKEFLLVKPTILLLMRDTHLMQQFIYYYKQLYMFRASICQSSGVLGCIRIILLHMVSSTRCCG